MGPGRASPAQLDYREYHLSWVNVHRQVGASPNSYLVEEARSGLKWAGTSSVRGWPGPGEACVPPSMRWLIAAPPWPSPP